MNNDDKIREMLEAEVPEELSPDNIKAMLDEKTAVKKRSGISVFRRTAAAAAALVVAVGGYTATKGMLGPHKSKNFAADNSTSFVAPPESAEIKDDPPEEFKPVHQDVSAPYMCGAESYDVIYTMMADANERAKNGEYNGYSKDLWYGAGYVEGGMGSSDSDSLPKDPFPSDEEQINGADFDAPNGSDESYSQTYDQEEGVLEADIVKTDGKRIYTLYAQHDGSIFEAEKETRTLLRIASVDNGKFSDPVEIAVPMYFDGEKPWHRDSVPTNMYIYNDLIIVITREYALYLGPEDMPYPNRTFVSFYTLDDEPQLIGHYAQDGDRADVRISPDGYMYIITSDDKDYYGFDRIGGPENLEMYIPHYGCDGEIDLMPSDDILIPKELDSGETIGYTIIGAIDLTVSAQFTPVDTKALMRNCLYGDSDLIYCSAENIYAHVGWDTTDITRISINKGHIEPAASGTIDGHIKDQFSLSEYNGHLRAAANVSRWIYADEEESISNIVAKSEEYNLVYVLDMDMNIVGQTERFGENERIKSASFSGDMGYVVTYRKTDPLFGIDLSDPVNPVITDEFKINGYSTYLQRWTDGLIFGFGIDADDEGRENGLKLNMFDVSDSNDLKIAGTFSIEKPEDSWVYSSAVWERKALLIAPEKNLIGVPVETMKNGCTMSNGYTFFSYDGGEFTELGWLGSEFDNKDDYYSVEIFDRAVYIGSYVYAVSGECFKSADMATITEVDSITFN